MFSGIVEEIGKVESVDSFGNGRRLVIAADRVRDSLRIGDSIAVEGVCLTVVALEPNGFTVEAIGTTLSRTTIGDLREGSSVNLERALALGDRLGGHLVQGHVDGVGEVVGVARRDDHVLIDVSMPREVADVTVLHGSVAINGVSLTVNALPAPDVLQVAIIPHTWAVTTFPQLRTGSLVNLEGDMLGKFVVNYLERRGGDARVAEAHSVAG